MAGYIKYMDPQFGDTTSEAIVVLKSTLEARFGVKRPFGLVVYGSSLYGQDSDLDLFIVLSEVEPSDIHWLASTVVRIHEDFGLHLDYDVSHEHKIPCTIEELEYAALGYGFLTKSGLLVTPTLLEPSFLESTEFKLRLLWNALVGPHHLAAGEPMLLTAPAATAQRFAVILAYILTGGSLLEEALMEALHGDGRVEGKMWIGFTRHPAVREHLKRVIRAHLQWVRRAVNGLPMFPTN